MSLTPELSALVAQFKRFQSKAVLYTLIATLTALKLRELIKAKKTKALTWTRFCPKYCGVQRGTMTGRINAQCNQIHLYLAKEGRLASLLEAEESNTEDFALFLELIDLACANDWIVFSDWSDIKAAVEGAIDANLALELEEEQDILTDFSSPRKRKNCGACYPDELPEEKVTITSQSDTNSSTYSSDSQSTKNAESACYNGQCNSKEVVCINCDFEDSSDSTGSATKAEAPTEADSNDSIIFIDFEAESAELSTGSLSEIVKGEIDAIIEDLQSMKDKDAVRDIIGRLCTLSLKLK
jgi:hypothetical protein